VRTSDHGAGGSGEPLVALEGIVKRFPGVVANDGVNLAVRGGEIRALVGENGAGKTTLMSVLYGLLQPDDGEIVLRGERVRFASPVSAIRAGIGMVHQHFMLFPSLTVLDNVIFGSEPVHHGLIDRGATRARVAELTRRYGLSVPPDRKVGELPVGSQQQVEILKALYRDADLLILDEPTAVLTPPEKDGLFVFLRDLTAKGRTVILITHKLNEVMEISDNATVMRHGRVTANLVTSETSTSEICRHMVGRDVLFTVDKDAARPGETILEVRDLSLPDSRGVNVLTDVSFSARAGEIVGIAGVAGSGQSALVQAITGLIPATEGTILLNGRDIGGLSVDARRQAGVAYIPEDRGQVGLATGASVVDNLSMGFQRQPQFTSNGLMRVERLRSRARSLVQRFAVRTASVRDAAAVLSGGNLQKLVVAREFDHTGPLLIAEQPTRGLDVGATEFVRQRLIAYRDQGHAVLLVSADLSEILALADRVYVMFEGRLIGEVAAAEADEYRLGMLMAGISEPAVQAAGRGHG
jgi:general nucleoside transport system ATP-binding protein